jgi:hypothetical protein
MRNYENAKIYGIFFGYDLVYIGSTVQTLNTRMKKHIADSKKYNNQKLYKFIRENGGIYNDFRIELLFDYSCNSRIELCLKEKEKINEFRPICNMYHNPDNYKIKEEYSHDEYLRKRWELN